MLTRDVIEPTVIQPGLLGRHRKPGPCQADEQHVLAHLSALLDQHGTGPDLLCAELPGRPIACIEDAWPEDAPLYGGMRGMFDGAFVSLVDAAPAGPYADAPTMEIPRLEYGRTGWSWRVDAVRITAALDRGSELLSAAAAFVQVRRRA